jgi:uncharacterized protein (TIGR00369 family)
MEENNFESLFRTSPFLETNGPFYQKKTTEESLIIGLRVLEKHLNGRGYTHAGILMTLADIAIGYQVAFSESPPLNLVTLNLNTDFIKASKLGDWLEAHVEIHKKGRNIIYASATILKGKEKIMRSGAIYKVIS